MEREVNEPVEPDKEKIRQDPYTLPAGFKWNTLDIGDEVVVSVFIHMDTLTLSSLIHIDQTMYSGVTICGLSTSFQVLCS